MDAIGIHAVGQKAIERVLAEPQWMKFIPTDLSIFLLVDSPDRGTLAELISATNCDTVQLQGPQKSDDIRQVSELAMSYGRKVVRTLGVSGPDSLAAIRDELEEVADAIDAVLIDSARYGGTGEVHDWRVTAEVGRIAHKPLVLAGGLTPQNSQAAIAQIGPWGIDVESGAERQFSLPAGKRVTAKDFVAIAELVSIVRRATPPVTD